MATNLKLCLPGHVRWNQLKPASSQLPNFASVSPKDWGPSGTSNLIPRIWSFAIATWTVIHSKFPMIWRSCSFWRHTDLNGDFGSTTPANLLSSFRVPDSLSYYVCNATSKISSGVILPWYASRPKKTMLQGFNSPLTPHQHQGFFDFHVIWVWAVASPSQLNHLIEDWTSLLSILWILSLSGLAYFCNSWYLSRCCTISRICDSFTHGTQTRRDRGGLVLASESYPWTRSYQPSSSTRRPDFCTMSLRSSRHYDHPYVGTFGNWQYGTYYGYYGPFWYIFRTSTSLRPVSNGVKFCTQLPPSCSILFSRGSPDPIQGHYPLQQHQGAIHWRNPLARAFPMSWPWTLLLWSFWQLGVVPAYSGLLATSFRDSPCTRPPSFSQCAHWDDISSRWTEPHHPDPWTSQGSFWRPEGCYGIGGIQWDVGNGWTHELPRCFRSPSTSSEFFFFWLKWSPVCTLGYYRFTLTGVLPIPPAKFFQKIQPRYMRGVCVCTIWTDVKLLFGFH